MKFSIDKVETFFGYYWWLWTLYFVIPLLIVDGIYQSYGYAFSFTSYHWFLHFFLLLTGLIIGKYYKVYLIKLISVPVFILEFYIYFRFLQPEILYFNPILAILNIIILIPMAFQILWCLFFIFYIPILLILDKLNQYQAKGNEKSLKDHSDWINFIHDVKNKKIIQFLIVFDLILIGLLPFATFGFGDTIVINDEGTQIKRVGFWHFGYQGINVSDYANPEAHEELTMLGKLNTFYMLQIHAGTLQDPVSYQLYSDLIRLYASYGIEVVLNANPYTLIYDKNSNAWGLAGDYVTYYHTESINQTIDLIMDWMDTEHFTNIIGLSFDTEGPVYPNASRPISKEQYYAAKYSFTEKLNEYKVRFPTMETMQISMEGILWDTIDYDPDVSITQKTVDYELPFDKFGYMTYHVSDSPRRSSYSYYAQMVQGKRVHGNQFQPWIGWIGENDSMANPVFYNNVFEHIKIAKNFATDDVIIGYAPTFTSNNHEEAMRRLNLLYDVLYKPFESFEIQINIRPWDQPIFPTYWIMNGEIFADIMDGDNKEDGSSNPWLLIIQITVIFGVNIILFYYIKFSKLKNHD